VLGGSDTGTVPAVSDTPVRATPEEIVVGRDDALCVTFADGQQCRFPVGALRAACPCAACRGRRERDGAEWTSPGAFDEISIVDAELVGAWGLSVRWSDGHDTGIYAWARLRHWWDDVLDGAQEQRP
jgi:DUF971 family protein